MSELRAIEAVVRGEVQGVGFRYATRTVARRLGLAGWVRNREDGAVEVFAQGPAERVGQLVQFLHFGPPHSVVDAVDVVPAGSQPGLTGFDVRF